MMETKQILIVTSEFPPLPGGIGNHAYNLAKQLSSKGYKVDVITDQRDKSFNTEDTFDSTLSFNAHRIRLKKMRWLMYLKRVQLLFKYIKTVDVVIASGKFSLWIVAFSTLFYNKKTVAVLHGSEVNFTNYILKFFVNLSLGRYSKLIAVSNYTKSLLQEQLIENCVVIPNGFNSEDFNTNFSERVQLNGSPILITLGNVTERKGQLNVIKHLPLIIKKYPNIHYHCVGLPTHSDEFITIARELGVDSYVTFHGRLSQSDVQLYLKSSDIFVMLSSTTIEGDVEGFGIAILEANFLNIPAIGATNCGIEDAIQNYKSGILINHLSADEFLNAIDTILVNKREYSIASKDWALKHTWDVIIQDYIKVITS